MEKIIKEGKELETIINEILEENSLTKEEIYYRYYNKKSGLFSKSNLVVEAITRDNLIEYIKTYLKELTTNMGFDVTLETKVRDDSIYIKLYSDNNAILIGKNGNTLKALETIVKQKINTDLGIHIYLTLDVENYKEKQEKRLVHLAKSLAKEVTKTKMEVHLENMNAYDRRIIHNALTNFKGIKTESEGEEPNRHIVIKPL